MDKSKKIRTQLRKKLEAAFPDLKFGLVLVCSTSGRGTKTLEDLIIKQFLANSNEELPFPFLSSDITEDWYLENKNSLNNLIEHLRIKAEQIQDIDRKKQVPHSILTWEEFVDIAKHFNIQTEDDCDMTAILLRHIGVLQHFRDLKFLKCKTLRNFVFLDYSM